MLFPRLRDALLVPIEFRGEHFPVGDGVIQIRELGIGAIIGKACKRTFFISKVAYREPFVTNPQMIADAKFKTVLYRGLPELSHNIPLDAHPGGVPPVVL